MAANVRRWGGYVLVGGTDLGHVGRHGAHLDLLATRQHGHPEAGRHGRHLASAGLGLGMLGLRAGQKVPDTGGSAPPPPALSTGGPSAPSAPSPVCAGGFGGAPAALRAVARSRSRVFTLLTRRSLSLVRSANRDSAARLSSLALDKRASRSRLAASALMVRTAHAPARCS